MTFVCRPIRRVAIPKTLDLGLAAPALVGQRRLAGADLFVPSVTNRDLFAEAAVSASMETHDAVAVRPATHRAKCDVGGAGRRGRPVLAAGIWRGIALVLAMRLPTGIC